MPLNLELFLNMAQLNNTQPTCMICQHSGCNHWEEVVDYSVSKESFSLADCPACGFRFTANPPAEENCGPYYDSQDYVSHSDTQKGVLFWVYHRVRSFMLSRKARLIKQLGQSKSLLDVGCGTGYFAGYMANLGYSVQGVEVDDRARKMASGKFHIPVFHPSHLLDGKMSGQFGFITLWHVMEHLYSPDRYWEEFHRLLAKDGYLIVAVPNHHGYDAKHYGKYWAGYDVPRHLWHFSPKTMQLLAERNNFRIIGMKSMPFDPFYNSLLSEKYKKSNSVWLSGLLIGGVAWLKGLVNTKQASSIIYIFQKTDS